MNPNLQNRQYQVTNKQTSNLAFKGTLGDKVVKQLVNKEKVAVASILTLTAGLVGLNKEKVSDVIESLVNKVNNLLCEKDSLIAEKEQLTNDLIVFQKEKEKAQEEGERSLGYTNDIVENQKTIIALKDAKIAELLKYEAMSKVKSVGEIGVVLPDVAIATLIEAGTKNKEAHTSLMNYLLTGKGQEEFLAQMNRNAILYKAKKDGIFEIPEVKEEFKKKQYSILPAVGNEPYTVACTMLGNCLKVQPKSDYIKSPAIREQIKTNAEALIEPLKEERVHYGTSVEAEIKSAFDFHLGLEKAKKSAYGQGLEYISETNDGVSTSQSYITFKQEDGNFVDYSLQYLMSGYWGCARVRTPEGEIIYDIIFKSIPDMLNPDLTASWEKGLDMVAKKEIEPEVFMQKLEKYIESKINKLVLK